MFYVTSVASLLGPSRHGANWASVAQANFFFIVARWSRYT